MYYSGSQEFFYVFFCSSVSSSFDLPEFFVSTARSGMSFNSSLIG